MAYQDIGFDEFLNRNIDNSQKGPDAFNPSQFEFFTDEVSGGKILSPVDGQYIASGIDASNITVGEMEFDRASGGTLTLGGRNNIEGVFSLVDEDGLEKISMNKDGMTINKGAMTIQDQNNKTIIDANGLVSSNSFNVGSVSKPDDFLTSSTDYVDIPNVTLSFNLKRPAKVLFLASGIPRVTGGTGMAFVYLVLDGIFTYAGFASRFDSSGGKWGPLNASHVVSLPAGNHTIKLMIACAFATQVGITEYELSYIILGT